MTHFLTLVALHPTEHVDEALAAALAPFSEEKVVERYRVNETGEAADFWMVSHLRGSGDLPTTGDLTWKQVAEAYNSHCNFHESDAERLLVDDDECAYLMSERNPHSKWDGWRIGGRWQGHFPVTAGGSLADPRLVRAEPIVYDSAGEPTWVDGGPRALLDFEALRTAAATEATESYVQWAALTDGLPTAEPWRTFSDRISGSDYSLADAQRDYRAQPVVERTRADEDFRWLGRPVDAFAGGHDAFVRRAALKAGLGGAYLDLSGEWHAPASGRDLFGTSSETAQHYEWVSAEMDALDPETVIVAVDCHI
ncbi:hypothetical protein [Streptomyces sp. SM12]|uniref:hypothetical protein n=1 Tax=Streptomyces sp. SM12 TaxID=1071602 RepID=UPI000CD562BF|nr:hypothetical protein [Streptomyces sp. SM12]